MTGSPTSTASVDHLLRDFCERSADLETQSGNSAFGEPPYVQPARRLVDADQADSVGQQHLVTAQQWRDVVQVGAVHPSNDVIEMVVAAEHRWLRALQQRVFEHLTQDQAHGTL